MNDKPFTEYSFREYLNQHKLMASQCHDCGKLYLPPRPICPDCHSEDMSWVETDGRGKLIAFTSVYIGPTAMVEAGYDRTNPYCAAVVELEEGPMISALLLGVDASQPDHISIGSPLTAAFVERGEGEERRTLLAFKA